MAVKRTPETYSTTILQRTTTGTAFDGTLPPGDPTLAKGQYKYSPAATGGLFYWEANEPIVVSQFHAWLGGSGDVSLYIVNLDANGAVVADERILIDDRTGVTRLSLSEDWRIVLMPGQALQFITSAVMGQAQIAQAVASVERAV